MTDPGHAADAGHAADVIDAPGRPDYRPGHRQEGWELRFDWGVEGLRAIADGAAAIVVVDVLRFTSAVSVAVGRELIGIGFGDDVDAAAALDADHVAPVLEGRAFAGVAPDGARHLR